MNNQMRIGEFTATVEYSAEDGLLVGHIDHIESVVMFSAESGNDIVVEFKKALEAYLKSCADRGVEPERPYKGTFNVRVPPRLHRQLAQVAAEQGQTLNQAVSAAADMYVQVHRTSADRRQQRGVS